MEHVHLTDNELIKYVNEVVLAKSFEQADLALDNALVTIASCITCYRNYLRIVREYKVTRN